VTSSELLAAYSGSAARAQRAPVADPFVCCAGCSVVFGRMPLTNLPCYEVF